MRWDKGKWPQLSIRSKVGWVKNPFFKLCPIKRWLRNCSIGIFTSRFCPQEMVFPVSELYLHCVKVQTFTISINSNPIRVIIILKI